MIVFQFNQQEIVIKREFGAEKDTFTLNDKVITRSELLCLLEAAGFSRSNPYYFVHQHEVTLLTRMAPPDRLKLLKEVAGTW